MTVGRLEDEMSNVEFVRWQVFFGRRAQREQLAEARAKTKGGR